MLDDFRRQASTSPFIDEADSELRAAPPRQHYFLGLSPVQRFVVALILLSMTCLVGVFLLLVTERVVLPFF